MLRELEAEPASTRHKIIDFFNRILVEYDDYASSIGDAVVILFKLVIVGRER